jgi:hypothetical protein
VNVRAAKSSFDSATLAVIVATITGDTASAEGVHGTGSSPILHLCRKLIALGYDPALPLVAVRGQTIYLKIRAIGEVAKLSIKPTGNGFERYRPGPQDRSSSPPIAPTRVMVGTGAHHNFPSRNRTGMPGKAGGYAVRRVAAPINIRRARRKVAS